MSDTPWAITASPESVAPTRTQQGFSPKEVTFTVTNRGARRVTGRTVLQPLGAVAAGWLELLGEVERDFEPNGTHTFTVRVKPPTAAPSGRHGFRLNMVDVHRPDEGEVEGPEVAVDVPEPARRPARAVPRWLLFAVAALVLAGAVIAGVILFANDPPNLPELADRSVASGETIDVPFEVVDEDLSAVTIEVSVDDSDLIPSDGIEVRGAEADRTLSITPAAGATGSAEITVLARDPQGREDSTTFSLEVVRAFGAWDASSWDEGSWGP